VTNIVGTALADTLTGGAGNDTLDGGGGGDLLVGGAANNTYIFDHGYGTETVQANVAVSTKNDTVQFGSGITDDELWFSQSGNDLDVSLIGTTDNVVVQNWFANSAAQVQQFETADGNVLMQSQVQNLVSAMASFGPPPSSSSGFGTTVPAQLEPVIAANWHPAVS
ncbi:MAG TPA: calcium-binding protein, partial [Candidatus Sulfotelmatobacter sp.]|nr:calcium-binding protein [Candidatus Sulfotelmatobacter sp.]